MSIRILQILAGLFALAAVLLIFLGWRLASQVPQSAGQEAGSGANMPALFEAVGYPAVVARNTLEAGQPVAAQDLAEVELSFAISGGFEDISQISDQPLARDVEVGSVLRQADFVEPVRIGNDMTPGMRGVAIAVDEIVGVGAHLVPDDRVDVLFVANSNLGSQTSLGRTLFSGLRVLSVGPSHVGQDVDASAEGTTRAARSVVLEVSEEMAALLTLADNAGVIRLSLIGRQEVNDTLALSEQMGQGEESLYQPASMAGSGEPASRQLFQLADLVMPGPASRQSAASAGNAGNSAGEDEEENERIVIQHLGNEVLRVAIPD